MAWSNSDKTILIDHLQELADYYGSRQPSDKALALWTRSLSSLSAGSVLSVLEDWPKTNDRFPTIDKVRAAAQERFSDQLEAQAKRDTAETPAISQIRPADPAVSRAFVRWKAARASLPAVSSTFWEQCGLLHLAYDRPIKNPFPSNRLGAYVPLGNLKREYLLAKYARNGVLDPAAIEAAKAAYNERFLAERKIPPFSQFLAEERAKEA